MTSSRAAHAREVIGRSSPASLSVLPLIERLPTGILILGTDGSILHANGAAARLLPTEGTLEGRDLFRDVLPPLERAGFGEQFRKGIQAGDLTLNWEGGLPSHSGERWLALEICSIPEAEEPVAVVVVDDRSDLHAERERRQRAERMAAVGDLAAGVAHEVNNPLASIKSFAELLAREATDAEQQRALGIIIDETTRIGRVVENLLSFARQQGVSGREPLNLSEIVEQVLELQRYALETAGIQVRRDLDASLTPVMGEAGALQQLVYNLVVNAEHSLAETEGERRLIIRTRESSEGVVISVVDNGPGISREDLPHIFESFQDGAGGFGLGTCAAIVRDHSGHIWAESEEGRGAAFNIRFPRRSEPSKSALAPVEPVEPPPPAPPTRPLRILVADDEATLRLALSLFLGRRGHEVTQAPDAYEALRLAKTMEFDVALVDARMPGDGLALLEKLEAMPSLRGRTALMTGDLGRARTSQGITTGRPYISKPFDLSEVVRLIEGLGQ